MASMSIPSKQKNGSISGKSYPSSSSLLDAETILADLRRHLDGGRGSSNDGKQTVAIPVAAIQALLDVIRRSEANTMMGLQMELQEASNIMMTHAMRSDSAISASQENSGTSLLGGRSIIPLASGCELFLKYVTRAFLELPDFKECRAQVLERGERFASISLAARERIADLGQAFIQDGMVVLTHGSSRVVSTLLLKAARAGKHFEIIVLEGRPDAGGAKAAKQFVEKGIPTSVILDSAMGYVMERVDMVLVGAEVISFGMNLHTTNNGMLIDTTGVVENGGIVNKIGTYALGIVARELGKPLYVAAESYKFARLFPLNQRDLPDRAMGGGSKLAFTDTTYYNSYTNCLPNERETAECSADKDFNETIKCTNGVRIVSLPEQLKVENPSCDYTPAKYITLLFTDLGVLTPSAVSDELIRLYQ